MEVGFFDSMEGSPVKRPVVRSFTEALSGPRPEKYCRERRRYLRSRGSFFRPRKSSDDSGNADISRSYYALPEW